MPRLSVIVPAHRHEQFLPRCIGSILNQKFRDIEIILVHWQSDICKKLATLDSRIKLLSIPPSTAAASRLAGVRISSSPYIGFADSDDWLDPNMYQSLMEIAGAYAYDMLVANYYVARGRHVHEVKLDLKPGHYDRSRMNSELLPLMLFRNDRQFRALNPAFWNKIFRREIIENSMQRVPAHISIAEDAAAVYPAVLASRSMYIQPQALYYYRQHATSISARYVPGFLPHTLQVCTLLDRASDSCDYPQLKTQIEGNRCYFSVQSVLNEGLSGQEKLQQIERISEICSNIDVQRSCRLTDISFYPLYSMISRQICNSRVDRLGTLARMYPLLQRISGNNM